VTDFFLLDNMYMKHVIEIYQ